MYERRCRPNAQRSTLGTGHRVADHKTKTDILKIKLCSTGNEIASPADVAETVFMSLMHT